jgi:hypothetical protein
MITTQHFRDEEENQVALEHEYREAKRKLEELEKRVKHLESQNQQIKSILRFVLELQKEQHAESDRAHGWLGEVLQSLSKRPEFANLQAQRFFDRGSQPAPRSADVLAPSIETLIDQLK